MAYKDPNDPRRKLSEQKYYAANKEIVKATAKAVKLERQARARVFIDVAKSKPCTDCGVQYPPYVMQFDHIGTDKKYNIAEMLDYGLATIEKEIAKCEVVCANCHAVRTWTRRQA